jgi:hypothetical protein
MGSEFLWQTSIDGTETFASMKPGYAVKNCQIFQDFVEENIKNMYANPIRQCYEEKEYTIVGMDICDATLGPTTPGPGIGGGSHFVPQSIMTASADRVFQLESCFSTEEGTCNDARSGDKIDNIILFLRKNYHPAITLSETVNEWTGGEAVPKPDLHSCWAQFSPRVLRMFNEIYAQDIQRFGTSGFIHPRAGVPDDRASFSDVGFVVSAKTLGEYESELGFKLQQNMGPGCMN